MKLKISTLIIFLSFQINAFSQIVINEYSASNLKVFIDNNLRTEDWVELYNMSDEAVDIGGYYLSDKTDNPLKFQIPEGTILNANDHMIFWCSGRGEYFNGEYHTNFKLTQTTEGDDLVLSNPAGSIMEIIEMELTLVEHSRCRVTDGAAEWSICKEPTLSNSNDGSEQYQRYTTAPSMSMNAGFYADSIIVEIMHPDTSETIRYTIDGTLPVRTSPIYEEPIMVNETTVVKARVFGDSTTIAGKIDFNTYFIDEDFTLDVYSIAADEVRDLANGDGEIIPFGSIEYFKNNQRTAISYGELNRHGQDSWILDHRSIDWVSRDEMGYTKDINAPIFTYSDRDEHQRLMFRASGDDNYPANDDFDHRGSTHVRDEYVHQLCLDGDMKLDVRAVERVIVFLDGQYWGVYGLRERPVDHDYTKYYYDQEKFDLQYVLTWGDTWAEYGGQDAIDDWEVIRDFVLDNDMSDENNYEFVEDNINLISMMDYMIVNLNCVSSDWMNYNTGFWRGLNPDGDHKKWGYIMWDNDATFDYYINYSGVPNTNPDAVPCDIEGISDFMDQFFGNSWSGANVGKHEKLFLKLQEESPVFRQLYYSRQADLMNTVFSCENMLTKLDSMIAIIEPEMPRQIDRWGGSMNEWENNVANLREFIEERCELLDDGMVECFDVTGPYNLTLKTEPDGIGEIDLNTLDIEEFPWSGNYFGGMENKIKARVFNDYEDDYQFSHWVSQNGSVIFPNESTRKATITLTGADTLTAVFGMNVAVEDLAEGFSFKVFPNPTSDNLTLSYELEQSHDIKVDLFSLTGQHLAAFPDAGGKKSAGYYNDILNLKEKEIVPGMYFLELRIGDKRRTMKVSVVQ